MTPFRIRERLKAFFRPSLPDIDDDEWVDLLNRAEEAEEETAAYDMEEMVKLLVDEARALTEKMNGWVPDDELLEEVLAMLPQSEDDLKNGPDTADILMEIQRKHILERFMGDYIDRLYSFQEDVATLDRDEYFKHYIHVGIMVSQLVQMMAVATQALVANAYLYKVREKVEEIKEATEKEAATPNQESSWMTWGMVTGEG